MPFSLTLCYLRVSSRNRLALFQTAAWGQRRAISWWLRLLRARWSQPEERYEWTLMHVWSLETFRKLLKLPSRANIGLSPDLFTPAFLQTRKKTQLPWIISSYPGLPIGILDTISWQWLESGGKISKFGGLKDAFYFSNLQMKCKFWSIGDLHKLTK